LADRQKADRRNANKESTNCRDHFFILPGTTVIEPKSLPMIAHSGKASCSLPLFTREKNRTAAVWRGPEYGLAVNLLPRNYIAGFAQKRV